jgi:hypothetical protein
MPEHPQLLVKIGADTTGVEAGMDASTEAVQSGADAMVAAFQRAAAAASELTTKLAAVNAANLATADTAKVAAKATADTEKVVARSFQGGGGFGGPKYMATYGASAAAGFGRFGFVLARLGQTAQSVFPVLIAGLGAIAAVHLGEMFVRWEQNTIDLKGALDSLNAALMAGAKQEQSAHYGYDSAVIQYDKLHHLYADAAAMVRRQESLAPIGVTLKIKQAELDSMHNAGVLLRTIANRVQEVYSNKQAKALIGDIPHEVAQNLSTIQSLTSQITNLEHTISAANAAARVDPRLAGATGQLSLELEHLKARRELAEKANQVLEQTGSTLVYKSGKIGLDTQNQLFTLHHQAAQHAAEQARVHERLTTAHKKVSEYDYERTHPNVMSAHSGYYTYYEREAEAEKKLAKADAVLAASKAKLASAMSVKGAVTFGDLMKQDDKRLEENSKRAAESVLKSWEDLRKKQAQEAKAIQTEQKKIAQGLFGGFNEGLKESIKGVMMGTESINMAWRRMMGNMLLSTITNWAEILMQHAEGWVALEILKAAGIATSERMDQVHAAKSAATDSHLSASHAFEKAMGAYPPPLNVPIAIAAAAAAAAANMSIAGFATGGIVPNTGIALVHQGEAVLPRPLTDHLMASTGKGGPTNITVHALDGADATNVLTRNRGAVASSLHRQLRSANLVQ